MKLHIDQEKLIKTINSLAGDLEGFCESSEVAIGTLTGPYGHQAQIILKLADMAGDETVSGDVREEYHSVKQGDGA